MAVLPELAGLFPDDGLRRGSTVVVDPSAGCGRGGTSLALALLAGATGAGSWAAAIGLGQLGLAAAAGLGVDLSRLALIPSPGAEWARVAAAMLDAVDVVLMSPPVAIKTGDARRLVARARERGSVLVICPGVGAGAGAGAGTGAGARSRAAWPEPPDLRLVPLHAEWQGLDRGHGLLRARLVEVEASGRGAAARPRRSSLWLPGEDGRVKVVDTGVAADVVEVAGAAGATGAVGAVGVVDVVDVAEVAG